MFYRRPVRSRRRAAQNCEALDSRALLSADLPAQLLADLGQSVLGGSPKLYVTDGTNSYFVVDNDGDGLFHGSLWKTDGTVGGTVKLVDGGTVITDLTMAADGTVFFSRSGSLSKTDGTVGGTEVVSTFSGNPTGLVPWSNGGVAFVAKTPETGFEVWRSDGTEAGTIVVDVAPGSASSNPRSLIVLDDAVLVFTADDGTNGREVWTYLFGAEMVSDINPTGHGVSYNAKLVESDHMVYFGATDGTDHGLWRTQGTPRSTIRLTGSNVSVAADIGLRDEIAPLGDGVVFAGIGSQGTELWSSDGTVAGTQLVKDIWSGSSSSNPEYMQTLGDEVWFRGSDGSAGAEPWKTDGTSDGTTLVADISPGVVGSSPQWFARVGDRILFAADDSAHGRELWQSDGTAVGTELLKDINPGPDSGFSFFRSRALGTRTRTVCSSRRTMARPGVSCGSQEALRPRQSCGRIS